MEEQSGMKKKNIVSVFVSFILVFLFLYKGVFLSGDEYREVYNELLGNSGLGKTSSMKKSKSLDNSVVASDPEKKAERLFFSEININLDSIESDAKQLKTSLTNFIEKNNITKDKLNEEQVSILLDKIDNLKGQIKDYQAKKNNKIN